MPKYPSLPLAQNCSRAPWRKTNAFWCRPAFGSGSDMICFNSSSLFSLIDTLSLHSSHSAPAPPHFPKGKETTNVERKWHKSSPPAGRPPGRGPHCSCHTCHKCPQPETDLHLRWTVKCRACPRLVGRHILVSVYLPPDCPTRPLRRLKKSWDCRQLIRSGNRAKWLEKISRTQFEVPFWSDSCRSWNFSHVGRISSCLHHRRRSRSLSPSLPEKFFISKRVEIRKKNKSFRAPFSLIPGRWRQQMKGTAQHLHKEKTCPVSMDGKEETLKLLTTTHFVFPTPLSNITVESSMCIQFSVI